MAAQVKAIGACIQAFQDRRRGFTDHRDAVALLPGTTVQALYLQKRAGKNEGEMPYQELLLDSQDLYSGRVSSGFSYRGQFCLVSKSRNQEGEVQSVNGFQYTMKNMTRAGL